MCSKKFSFERIWLIMKGAAKELGEELGVDRVMECSAKTTVGLVELFDEAIKVGLAAKSKSKIKKRKKCVLL